MPAPRDAYYRVCRSGHSTGIVRNREDASQAGGRPAGPPHGTLAVCLAVAALVIWPLARGETPDPQVPRARTFKDGIGRSLTLDGTPSRIISMAPSVSEMLYALGLGDRIVGVSDFCRVPGGIATPARIGGLIDPDLERIVSLKADLVVATTSGNYVEDIDRIGALGIPVYTCDTPSVEDVLTTIVALGRIAGAEDAARSLEGSLRARLEAVQRRVSGSARPRVLFIIWGDPILAPGRDAFVSDALSLAGAASISADASARWTEFDLEQVLAGRPDVILTVPDNRIFAESLGSRPEWAIVPAVREGRIHVVSDAIQQPGPRIVEGIEEIAALLHPE